MSARWIARVAAGLMAVGCLAGTGSAEAATRVPSACKNQLAYWLHDAGFRGVHHRVAWAVAMRESNGRPSTYWGGAAGLMQLQYSAWAGTRYWPADPYDPVQNATAARRIVKAYNWRPWGLWVSGRRVSFDFSHYRSWSSARHYAWIVEPYRRYEAQYPHKCKPVKVRAR